MAVRFDIPDPRGAIVEHVRSAEAQGRIAKTSREKLVQRSMAAGMQDALVLVDAFMRSVEPEPTQYEAVELRSYEEISAEYDGA